ncbi:GIY-YIG nuclease family protein [Streptomyces sp. NPDC096040]|uniref:GIY-YIG nuclease family protein n=1 Tax=Streptomyces sp. NPDC096040 TaxID=3155541 RepID=UPI00331DF6B2
MGATRETTARRAAVYRLWAADGSLLYVGSSYDPEERCKRHRSAPWWPLVARRTDDWRSSRAHAYHAESAAIMDEGPAHNVMGSTAHQEECRRRARQDPAHQARVRAGSAAANGAPREVVDAILRGDLKSWGPRSGPVPFTE